MNQMNYASVCRGMSRVAPNFHHFIKSLLLMLNVYHPFPVNVLQLYALDDAKAQRKERGIPKITLLGKGLVQGRLREGLCPVRM